MEDSSLLSKISAWFQESVMIKLISIGFLALILLIPTALITELIEERQSRAGGVIGEITSKWSNAQTINGPVLMIPFTKVEMFKRWEQGVQIEEKVETVHRAYFLPLELSANGNLNPEVRHRGIFEAVVYTSTVDLSAKFDDISFEKWGIKDDQVHWNEATLLIGISDLRGIKENPTIKSGERSFASEPSSDTRLATYVPSVDTYSQADSRSIKSPGIATLLGWKSRQDFLSEYKISLQLKGSEQLYFVPAGKTTEVKLTGAWATPSFDGQMLPTNPEINEGGFSATWKILSYNRPFAQQWLDSEQSLSGSEFGVKLLIPADQYQKSIRTAKYGILVILLAFTALFLVEISSKVRIHPFQYILVGVALIIYYSLLLSLSEHLGYNVAYLISTVCTVTLVTLYSRTFLNSRPVVLTFSALMTVFYGFIFVIIQAEDFSLLIGSVGLFMIIAAIMYFSRNIKWYKEIKA